MHQRRESYLNSQFNRRKNTLKEITKTNRKIYERINSQKSLYSQKKMNKSTDSLRSLSRCSSRSKNSKAGHPQAKNPSKRPQTKMTVQAENIRDIKNAGLDEFKNIFSQNRSRNQENDRMISSQATNRSLSERNHRDSKPL